MAAKKNYCEQYEGKPSITLAFCMKRYEKAHAEKNDCRFDNCRACEQGKQAFEELNKTNKQRKWKAGDNWRTPRKSKETSCAK